MNNMSSNKFQLNNKVISTLYYISSSVFASGKSINYCFFFLNQSFVDLYRV